MSVITAKDGGAQGQLVGYGSKAYRNYVLFALTLIYILNFVDRALLAVVGPDLVPDLGITDTQFGLLTGFGFALLYTAVGIPLARFADVANRVWIMTVCVALWSLMTALCGLATEVTIGSVTIGAFWILLMCRVGVGIGEAGCTPPANSLIADYFIPRERSQALGFYAMGVTLGTMFANLIGGWVTDMFDWRTAFFVVGLPGLLVALVFKLTVKEPPRGYTDPPQAETKERASLGEAIHELMGKPAFWLMTAGATIAAFCGYGISSFQSLFLVRTYEITAGQAAIWINTPVALSAAVGTFATGWLATKIYKKHPGAIAWVPAVGLAVSVPFYIFAFTTDNLLYAAIGLVIAGFVKYGYLAAQYTIGQGVVSMRVRAMATAVMLLLVNLIGYGFGPLFIGAVSDIFFKSGVAEFGVAAGELARNQCHPTVLGQLSQNLQEVCGQVYAQSLQTSMVIMACLYFGSALCFLLTWRRLGKDMVDRQVINPVTP
ncbi:MFS transporter [Halopseudomonas pelagia]|uniref:spinster family MFS transporter n=1 Tax=Halopseudomonas pelagia TaxID=553151 RepID=UPI0030D82DAC|tara:strand:- start:1228 stop:2694 length:1467 start_codon:yes stop_codon:yes gene_type:complete